MRSFFLAILLTICASSASASSLFDGPPIGTYKTLSVKSISACSKICESESETCRGNIVYQPDVTEDIYFCHLNDGLAAGSPFEILPPEPLDFDIALSDLNTYRARYGLNPVRLDPQLTTASRLHAEDLAHHGIISHSGTDGSTHSDRVERTGYKFSIVAENVASGQNSWSDVFKAWQDSPGHNENLLLPEVTDFGVALVYDRTTQYRYYWAMLVAAPF